MASSGTPSARNLLKRLDLTTLQLFLAVYEEGTLTRAADRETIAISAASKRLLELEQTVGAALFVRKARGMELTAAGETLLHHARRVMRDVENIGIELAEHATGVRGYVRMVANLSAIVEFLPEDLRDFLSVNSQVKIDLEERPSAVVVKSVADSLADLGICSGEADTRGLQVTHYRHDQLAVVMRPDHPLAARMRIGFAETLDSDYVGLHSASSINLRTHQAARQAGKTLRLRIQVPGFDAVCRMVQAGMGLGVIPLDYYTRVGRAMGLRAVALGDEWAYRKLIVVVRDVEALSPVSRLLFEHLRSVEASATPPLANDGVLEDEGKGKRKGTDSDSGPDMRKPASTTKRPTTVAGASGRIETTPRKAAAPKQARERRTRK